MANLAFADATAREAYDISQEEYLEKQEFLQEDTGGIYVAKATGIGAANWKQVSGAQAARAGVAGAAAGSLPSAGGTMSGDIDMDGNTVTGLDTPSADSDAATKVYVDGLVTGLLDFKGNLDCGANPNYPAASKGDAYLVSVAGKVGGGSGVVVEVGDTVIASDDNAGGTQAAVGADWFIIQANVTILPIVKGGTGADDATEARENLLLRFPAVADETALALVVVAADDVTAGRIIQQTAGTYPGLYSAYAAGTGLDKWKPVSPVAPINVTASGAFSLLIPPGAVGIDVNMWPGAWGGSGGDSGEGGSTAAEGAGGDSGIGGDSVLPTRCVIPSGLTPGGTLDGSVGAGGAPGAGGVALAADAAGTASQPGDPGLTGDNTSVTGFAVTRVDAFVAAAPFLTLKGGVAGTGGAATAAGTTPANRGGSVAGTGGASAAATGGGGAGGGAAGDSPPGSAAANTVSGAGGAGGGLDTDGVTAPAGTGTVKLGQGGPGGGGGGGGGVKAVTGTKGGDGRIGVAGSTGAVKGQWLF